MKINFNISPQRLRIGLVGIIIGCISAFSFAVVYFVWVSKINIVIQEFLVFYFSRFAPGCMFGFAVAVTYFRNAERKSAIRLFWAGVITITGVICYQIAHWITILSIAFAGDVTLSVAPAGAAVGGFVGTWIFVTCLQMLTNKYTTVRNRFSVYGGLLGAILIDSITYVINTTSSSKISGSAILLGSSVFFIGWQTIMLLIISDPLLKNVDNQISNPTAVAGPVNDSAPQ